MNEPSELPSQIVLFDGVCHLCASAVKFILKRDTKAKFHFAPLQSSIGHKLLTRHGIDPTQLDTFVLIQDGIAHTRSTAALNIARQLSYPWPLLYPAILLPQWIRDSIYRFIATHRYQWFGKSESCLMPDPTWKQRFL